MVQFSREFHVLSTEAWQYSYKGIGMDQFVELTKPYSFFRSIELADAINCLHGIHDVAQAAEKGRRRMSAGAR